MIIDDTELEHNSKIKYPKLNNSISTPKKIDINKRNISDSIDDNLRGLFPYLNEEV